MTVTPNPLPPHVLAALRAGNKLEAVKLLREATGLGLMESKEIIDGYDDGNRSHAVIASAVKAGTGAPGEVPRSGRLNWYVVAAVAVAAFFAGYVLRSAGL